MRSWSAIEASRWLSEDTARRSQPSLHCHLGSLLSSRRQLSREHLASSLPSECANEHSQRLVRMIARRASSCSASRPPIALLSRPDHNPGSRCMVHLSISSAQHVRDRPWPSRNCSISAQSRRGRARQPMGTERSGWLDGAEDRRTISRRDGHSLATAMLSENDVTNETRRLEDRQEMTARCRLGRRFGASARSPI